MQTVYDIRRANLRVLAQQWGGPTSLNRKLGHSNGSYLAKAAIAIAACNTLLIIALHV